MRWSLFKALRLVYQTAFEKEPSCASGTRQGLEASHVVSLPWSRGTLSMARQHLILTISGIWCSEKTWNHKILHLVADSDGCFARQDCIQQGRVVVGDGVCARQRDYILPFATSNRQRKPWCRLCHALIQVLTCRHSIQRMETCLGKSVRVWSRFTPCRRISPSVYWLTGRKQFKLQIWESRRCLCGHSCRILPKRSKEFLTWRMKRLWEDSLDLSNQT